MIGMYVWLRSSYDSGDLLCAYYTAFNLILTWVQSDPLRGPGVRGTQRRSLRGSVVLPP